MDWTLIGQMIDVWMEGLGAEPKITISPNTDIIELNANTADKTCAVAVKSEEIERFGARFVGKALQKQSRLMLGLPILST